LGLVADPAPGLRPLRHHLPGPRPEPPPPPGREDAEATAGITGRRAGSSDRTTPRPRSRPHPPRPRDETGPGPKPLEVAEEKPRQIASGRTIWAVRMQPSIPWAGGRNRPPAPRDGRPAWPARTTPTTFIKGAAAWRPSPLRRGGRPALRPGGRPGGPSFCVTCRYSSTPLVCPPPRSARSAMTTQMSGLMAGGRPARGNAAHYKHTIRKRIRALLDQHRARRRRIGQRPFLVTEPPRQRASGIAAPTSTTPPSPGFKELGGVARIRDPPHPHYYTTMVDWSLSRPGRPPILITSWMKNGDASPTRCVRTGWDSTDHRRRRSSFCPAGTSTASRASTGPAGSPGSGRPARGRPAAVAMDPESGGPSCKLPDISRSTPWRSGRIKASLGAYRFAPYWAFPARGKGPSSPGTPTPSSPSRDALPAGVSCETIRVQSESFRPPLRASPGAEGRR